MTLHFISFYHHKVQEGVGKSPWPMYQVCMSPWDGVYTNYTKLMPLNQIFGHMYVLSGIVCNIFLYHYLQKMTEKNMALKIHDRKACRKRNLVPAKTGMIHLLFYILFFVIFALPLGTNQVHIGTRAFFNCLVTDIAYCIMCPVIILSGNQVAQRKIRNLFNNCKNRVDDAFETVCNLFK